MTSLVGIPSPLHECVPKVNSVCMTVDKCVLVLYKGHMECSHTIPLLEYDCCRCLHHWVPRKAERPKRCPSCTSAYWDTPKIEREPEASA